MNGALAHDEAERLRAELSRLLAEVGAPDEGPTKDAFIRVIEVLESSPGAVVMPSDELLTSQEAADVLGVSRMTVVRLTDRGEITAEPGGSHRRIAASELARYRAIATARRSAALEGLMHDLEDLPDDQIVSTR